MSKTSQRKKSYYKLGFNHALTGFDSRIPTKHHKHYKSYNHGYSDGLKELNAKRSKLSIEEFEDL